MKMILRAHMFRAESATTERWSDGHGFNRSWKIDVFDQYSRSTQLTLHWRGGFCGEYMSSSLNRTYRNRYHNEVWSCCSVRGEIDIMKMILRKNIRRMSNNSKMNHSPRGSLKYSYRIDSRLEKQKSICFSNYRSLIFNEEVFF